MAQAKRYSEKDVQVLDAVTGIRKRTTMYIGSVDAHGLFHIFKEVADNAVDEFLAGRNTAVYVSTDGVKVTVGDDGQGIPTGIHKVTKRPTLETVFTENHAGGKFSDAAYATSIGTHGIGVTATNAVSETLQVWSNYTGSWQSIIFNKGKVSKELHKAKPPKLPFAPSGTIVQFTPDMSIFDKGAKLQLREVKEWAEMAAYMNAGLKVVYHNSVTGDTVTYQFKRGLDDLLDKLNKQNEAKEVGRYSDNTVNYDLALSWSEQVQVSESLLFTNTSRNHRGGSHEKVLWSCLYDVLSEYAEKDQEFEAVDLQPGCTAVFNVKLSEPKFSSQTKERLSDPRVKDFEEPLTKALAKFFKSNADLAAGLVESAALVYQARTRTAIDKDLARKLKSESRAGTLLPGKLTFCPKAKPEQRELFLVEGDSAGGSAVPARTNVHTQEILKLKGKPINAARADVARYSANQEVFNILLALGYKPDAADPYAELRVRNKIIFLTDPDVDGAHISLLLLALLAKVLPELFKRKLVYVVDAPEYMATVKGKRYYGNTKAELAAALPKGANVDMQHIKGWGEVSPQVLREVAFDPNTRKLICITAKKAARISEFLTLMSNEGALARKTLLGV